MEPWWTSLVGVPYAFPSRPPESFDCWTLVRHVRERLGKDCPLPFRDDEPWCQPANIARAVARARPMWRVLHQPIHGAMAVLRPDHVGVVLGPGVLHALARGASVVWTPLAGVRRMFPAVEWWEADRA
jgi:cell wall-associated NlpC family hydrolase